jgi:hypothetical protein
LPSPASLGFVKGARVGDVHYHPSQRPLGTVKRVYPNCVVVVFDNGLHMQCHPQGRLVVLDEDAKTEAPR